MAIYMTQLRVLVIDDDQDTCQSLVDFLAYEGHQARATTNAQEGLDLLRQKEYHVVVLDLVMPQVSGLDLLPTIRSIDSDLAIVILTGYPTVDSATTSISHGVSAYIRKPYSLDELREAIGRIARHKGLLWRGEEELLHTIGSRIRALRKKKGLTLRQIARRTHLSISLLSQVERAESAASVTSLYKLAAALDVKMADLLADF